jgi:polysaccharide deacetylase 2 family uncharacterized protein YibQ
LAARRKSRSRRRPAAVWWWIAGVVAVVAVTAVGVMGWSRTDRGQAALLTMGAEALFHDVQQRLEDRLVAELAGFRRGDQTAVDQPDAHDWPTAGDAPGEAIRCRVVPVAADGAWWQVLDRLGRAVEAAGGRVLWSERLARSDRRGDREDPDERRDLMRVDVGVAGRPTHTLILYREDAGRPDVRWGGDPAAGAWQQLRRRASGPVVALVIDDWGHKPGAVTDGLLALDVPLTMSVLPGRPYSRHFGLMGTDLALPPAAGGVTGDERRHRLAAAGCPVTVGVGRHRADLPVRRREIFLHQPMQPQGYPDVDPGPRALLVGMSRTEMADVLAENLHGLPDARGLNNHMGSAATSDQGTMDDLMDLLAQRDLLFLDSLTTARSVAYATAVAAGVPALRNRIFLDHDHQDRAKVRRRLHDLVAAARATGFAVGIGHPNAATLDVLRQELPRLVAEGVTFVTASELHALQEAAAGAAAP